MADILLSLKADLAGRGLKIKDIADKTGISYDRLVRVLNGYISDPQAVISEIRNVIRCFDQQEQNGN